MQNRIFQITGLTCNNCANKVKMALNAAAEKIDISPDLAKIEFVNLNQEVSALNAQLSLVGKYVIGAELNKIATENLAKTAHNDSEQIEKVPFLVTYRPLLLVFGYILLACICVEVVNGGFALHRFMPNFMAGFFLVFSFFKLLDLTGFAQSYAMYDVIAKRFFAYGFIYPFIEAGLGAAWILAPSHALTSSVTLIVMLVSLIGVVQAVFSGQKIKCACLGAGFNLPMSTVTIIEDSLMAAMAAWMLI
jgi:copper chaperone CopZ